ncbi:hypothetical protein C1H46_022840 [Malus baccata]|uniref:Uncharacterized protein n=1 Tax=Malus baccata TaxID=106549 RepID=A0A540LYM1_MALBA|nr:hypothetical protein C1H46_022840 [Malus baccata]
MALEPTIFPSISNPVDPLADELGAAVFASTTSWCSDYPGCRQSIINDKQVIYGVVPVSLRPMEDT